MTFADQRGSRGVGRINCKRSLEQVDAVARAFRSVLVKLSNRAQIHIVGVEALCWLSISPFDLGAARVRLYYAGDTASHLGLWFADVGDSPVGLIGPHLRAGRGFDLLRRDAD